ncbi:phospholipid scramblase-related protein [Streptomyces sp. NPDC059740]|uniref:phospholipid scramblase-related protein n=1 Tax=Streptomyces sp. NPDC059740 TaxID=3346926 RepID=UPI00365741E9
MTQPNIPAGWYADPQGAADLLRWWDGARWTEHTHPARQTQPSPAPAAQQQAPQPQVQQPQQQVQQPAPIPQQAPPHQMPQQQVPQQHFAPQQGAPAGVQAPGQQAPHQGGPQGGRPQGGTQWEKGAGQPHGQADPYHQAPGQPYGQGPAGPPGQQQAPGQQPMGVQPMGMAPMGTQGGPQGPVPALFTEPVLVVNQKAKVIEVTNEYSVFDRNGNAIGTVVEVGQNMAKKVLRVVSKLDQYMTHKLEIRDAYGQPQLVLTRPAKLLKSKVLVQRPDGSMVGEIVQKNVIGKIDFAMMVGDQQIGAIRGESWWQWKFQIVDHTGQEVARVTKLVENIASALFTTADNYALEIHQQLPEPLLSLVVASALTIDTALKQDER